MSIVPEEAAGNSSPAVQRAMTIAAPDAATQSSQQQQHRDRDTDRAFPNNTNTEPPPQSQQHPPPYTQMQSSGALASPAHPPPQAQMVNGHSQHNIPSSPEPMRELHQFAQWASAAIESSNRDIIRMGAAVTAIEKDIRNFNGMLHELRNDLLSRPGPRDITALRSEIQVLRESRSDALSVVKGQSFTSDEFEVLTDNMSKISEKANAVDDIKMQLDFLKSRTKRLEEVTRGVQSFPTSHPTPGSEPRHSPQNHTSPFVPSMNHHGLPSSALHGPLSGRENPPNRVVSSNTAEAQGISLPRKREAESISILPTIPIAYQSDENEHQQKRFKYGNVPYPGDKIITAEFRSLAAQPTLAAHEARTFVMTENGDFKPSHPGFVADPLTPKPKPMAFRGGGRGGRGGSRGSGNIGREMGRVSQYSPPPTESVERQSPYQSYEGMSGAGTAGGEWLGNNPAVSAARTTEPYPDPKSARRNSEGVALTKNGRPDGRSIKRRPILRNSDGIPVTRSGKPDGRFLAARVRKNEDQSQSPVASNGHDEGGEDSRRAENSYEVGTSSTPSEQLGVVENEVSMNGDGSGADMDAREQLIPVTPVMAAAPPPVPVTTEKAGSD